MAFIKFFLLLCCLFTFGYGIDLRAKYSREIIRSFEKKIRAKGLTPIGIGEGINHETGKQNYLQITSFVKSLPNIEYARKLIIKTIDDFLFEINSNEKMRPYLSCFPFSLKNIRISLLSEDDDNGLVSVSNCEEELNYRKKHPDPFYKHNVRIHSETYEEAKKILSNSQEN